MKRQFAYSLYFLCLGLLTVVFASAPVFAYRVDPGCPNSEKMMANPDHSGWKNPMCFLEVAAYVKSLKDKGPAKCQEHGEAMQQMFEKNRQKIRDLRVANNPEWDTWFTVRSELLQTCRMADPNDAYVWNAQTRASVKVPRTRDEVIQKKVEHQTAMAKIMEVLPGWPRPKVWEDTSKANKRVVNLQGLLDLMIQKVQAGADLTPFIELIVNEGKPNKQDPHYVSDDVINTAFLLYAYSVPANRADKILKYTNMKYAPRVRFAAANAVAQFAKDKKTRNGLMPNEPAGHLSLSDKQREQVWDIFGIVFDNAKTDFTREVVQYQLNRVYGDVNWLAKQGKPVAPQQDQAAFGSMTIPLPGYLAPILAAQTNVAEAIASVNTFVASGMTALQAALAAPAAGMVGEISIVVVPVYIFGKALDDAFAPTYRVAFEHRLREALGVESFPSVTVADAYTQAFDGNYMVQTLTGTKADATTRTQVKQMAQCIHQYTATISAATCPTFKRIPLNGSFEQAYAMNPTLIHSQFISGDPVDQARFSGIMKCIKNPNDRSCINPVFNAAAEFKQLEQIWEERCSFKGKIPTGNTAMTEQPLFVRATFLESAKEWIPSAEIQLDTNFIVGENMPNQEGGKFVISQKKPLYKFLLFVEQWLGVDLNVGGVVDGIVKRKPFRSRTIGDMRIRDGIHKDDKQIRDHIHVGKTSCLYTPRNVNRTTCLPMATSSSAGGGTQKYECNISFQYTK